MDLESFAEREDGWDLISEAEYSIKCIRNYVNGSCLADKCDFLKEINDVTDDGEVEKLCLGFKALLKEEATLDEISALMVVACMLYTLEDASIETIECRTSFLHATFFHTDSLSPQHLHVAVERIWDGLKSPTDNKYVMNILSICREITAINWTGKAIAICLAWCVICEITETEMGMYCFHEFSEINRMLEEIDPEMLQQEESTQVIYILIQVIGFLINAIVFGPKDEFIKVGYRNYFKYKRQDLELLKTWAEQLSKYVCLSANNPKKYWGIRMSMDEYIKMNIVALLYDRIREMQ